MTDPLGQSQVIPYLACLAQKGYRITIVSCEKEENSKNRKDFIQNLLTEQNIQWEPIPYTASPPVFSTMKDIRQLKKKACEIINEQNIKLIHCRSYISAMVGVYAKKKFDIPFIFDMRGFWPDERVEGNIWNLKNPVFKLVYSFFKKKEIEYFEEAAHTVSLTLAGRKEIHSWKTIKNNPINIEVIPCCADLNHFDYENIDPEKQLILKKGLGIPETAKVISYLGSVGTWYMLSEMLDFFKAFLSEYSNAQFLFISGDSEQFITEEAQKKGIPADKIIVRKANREDVPLFISLSTASLFFIKPVFSKKASSPTKMGEVMGMGIPIICNSGVGDVASIVSDTKCGIVIDEFTPMEYSTIINKFAELTSTPREQIRKGAEKYYSLENGAEKYAQIYKKILQ